jgi:hypothetical protein
MANYNSFLAELNVYPTSDQIAEAVAYAKNKILIYAAECENCVVVDIQEGDVVIKWVGETEWNAESEIEGDIQVEFDEAFAEKIEELQKNIRIKY